MNFTFGKVLLLLRRCNTYDTIRGGHVFGVNHDTHAKLTNGQLGAPEPVHRRSELLARQHSRLGFSPNRRRWYIYMYIYIYPTPGVDVYVGMIEDEQQVDIDHMWE